MTHSKLTNRIHLAPASQHSSRNGTTVDTFLIHHQASTNSAATESDMVNATKDVSANYIITNEGELVLIVDEDRRAHTSGSRYDGGKGAQWDRRSITVEIENETAAPDWKISAKAIQTAARLLADLRKRRKITNTLGHRDLWERFRASYPTFCPGPDTVAKIVNAADALTKGGTSTPAAPKPAAASGTGYAGVKLGSNDAKAAANRVDRWVKAPGGEAGAPYWPEGPLMQRIQNILKARGRYDGVTDGVGATKTAKAIQETLNVSELNGVRPYVKTAVDGKLGRNNAYGVQHYARKHGDYTGDIDGDPRVNSWIGFALGLERP